MFGGSVWVTQAILLAYSFAPASVGKRIAITTSNPTKIKVQRRRGGFHVCGTLTQTIL